MAFELSKMLLIFGIALIVPVLTAPADGDQSIVVTSTSTVPPLPKESEKEGKPVENAPSVPQIYQMHVKSNISNRFAHTTVTSRVRNFGDKAQEAVFSIVLPESGFISGFIMEINGKNYTAYVKEKEEAKRDYDQAVASGLGAAHVAVSARDSNRFTVSVNIEPEAKAAFYLTYEQLLKRQDSHYEQVINIHPGQPVKDLSVEVLISESRKIVNLKAPPLRSGNEIGTDKPELDPRADITIVNDTAAIVTFSPNLERQKELAHVLGTKEENGLSGQFVVQYDVERDPSGGEVLIQDGYFVHFFAPTELKPLPKQVVFVLDTSGSMWGQKIEQLKQAMLNILDQLNEHDTLNLVEFNSNTKVWNIHDQEQSVWYPHKNTYYYHPSSDNRQPVVTLENTTFPRAYPANADNIKKAKDAITAIKSDGSTAMYGALQVALRLVELERTQPSESDPIKRQPIVIFLTDGQPTDLTTDEITTKITEFNSETKKSAIFGLSFGDGADKEFLQKLALRNSGFSRHIYEGADASLQLQDFYRQISSPLLSDVTFKYEPTTTSLTKTNFPIHFGGSEIVVAGFCGTGLPTPIIDGFGIGGPVSLKPVVTTTISNMERLWAYMSINQLLEKKEASDADKEKLKKQALDLALKYNFVTPVSSLVVVKPNDTSAVDTEEAKQGGGGLPLAGGAAYGGSFASFAGSPPAFAPASAGIFHARPGIAITGATYRPLLLTTYLTTNKPRSALQILVDALPWLNAILDNGFIKAPQGSYKLGLNETISEKVTCPKTPFDQEGHCALLHECPQVHSKLQTSTNFFDHFCILKDEFAGICCPN